RREFTWQSGTWAQTNEVLYVYDRSVVVQERIVGSVPQTSYTRGPGINGRIARAGGIGGLLARTDHTRSANASLPPRAFYHCDAVGSVTAMISPEQSLVAIYAYGPFGQLLASKGTLAAPNTYRFS